MDLSILIVSFKTKKYLAKALESLLKSESSLSMEILVIDNNSQDGTIEMINEDFPSVRLISNNTNEGFAIAMNQGFRVCSGRYVLAFNPDAEVKPATLSILVSYLDKNPQIGLLAGGIEDEEGRMKLPAHDFPLLYLQSIRGLRKSKLPITNNKPIKVDWVWGSGLTVRRDLFDGVTLFKEISFLFGEEYYLAQHVKSVGKEIWIHPEIKFIHHGSVTFKFDKKKLTMATLLLESNVYRIKKLHFGFLMTKLATCILSLDALALLIRVRLACILKRKRNDLVAKRMMAKYQSMIHARVGALFMGEKFSREVNEKARAYFNTI